MKVFYIILFPKIIFWMTTIRKWRTLFVKAVFCFKLKWRKNVIETFVQVHIKDQAADQLTIPLNKLPWTVQHMDLEPIRPLRWCQWTCLNQTLKSSQQIDEIFKIYLSLKSSQMQDDVFLLAQARFSSMSFWFLHWNFGRFFHYFYLEKIFEP